MEGEEPSKSVEAPPTEEATEQGAAETEPASAPEPAEPQEQAGDSTPADAQPADAADTQATELQSADAQPAEAQPTDSQPADKQPEDSQPAETQPTGSQPADAQPAETPPPTTDSQPADTPPAETPDSKPADVQPTDSKPAEAQPTDSKPAEPQSTDSKPAEAQPADSQPAEASAASSQPTESKNEGEPKQSENESNQNQPTAPAGKPTRVIPQAWQSQESNLVLVKFLVLPDGFSHVKQYPADIPAVYMYSQLEKDLCVDKNTIHISWEGRPFQETDILNEVATIPDSGLLILHLQFDDLPKHLQILSVGEMTSGTRNVNIEYGEGIPSKNYIVTLVIAFDKKPFIGGFRHKKTEVHYHHAVAQTDPVCREERTRYDKVSRDTQTRGVTRTIQTVRECGTQMAHSGHIVSTEDDKIFYSRPYFTSQQLHDLRIAKSVVIQSHVRGWFARKYAKQLRKEREEIQQKIAAEESKRALEHNRKRQREIKRRTHPRSARDFTTLYNELEAWRLQETQNIKESDMTKEEAHLALQELLKKETKLLQTIHKLQNATNKQNKERKIKTLLEEMTAYKSWGKSGTVVETPFTVRARELMDLYCGLQLTGLSIDERLDILLHIKWTVKEFSCPLTREVVELVDREADILNRGRPSKTLEGQRQRLNNLFLQFIETPEFNPEAIHHQPVPLEFSSRPLVKLDNKR
eukprot:TRINITY_DN3204_c0_g1_i2.p1 TRINITY_DN3204_c0_g1~~TRINITY_DN3204_c0_g1_i2.p1  ORF type:complete len:696 (+),score=142.97 TRINITY_DN3204_c0_g1_i2:36-2123(+)